MDSNNEAIVGEILGKCLCLDRMAYETYSRFADEASDPVFSMEWETIAEDEKRHMDFWGKAIKIYKKGTFPDILENPGLLLTKLEDAIERIRNILDSFNAYDNQSEALSMSFLMESLMLDPVFMMLFHNFKFIDEDIEDEYELHLNKFVDMMRLSYTSDSGMAQVEFFCETLINLFVLNRMLLKEKSTDILTGIYNRAGFFSCIEPLLGLAGRNELNVGIIMADLDNFKSINDTYGHPVGDKALKAAASIIEASLRKSDIPGRYGGEEFIVFASSEDADSLGAICERIRENIDKKSKDLCGIHFTVSLGAAYSKIEGSEKETLTKLIKIADDKLLEAKKAGKNCWIV